MNSRNNRQQLVGNPFAALSEEEDQHAEDDDDMFEEDATNLGTLYTINEGEEEVQHGDKRGLYTLDEGEEKVLLKMKDLTCVPCSKSSCCKPANGQKCKTGTFTGLLFCKKHSVKVEGYEPQWLCEAATPPPSSHAAG